MQARRLGEVQYGCHDKLQISHMTSIPPEAGGGKKRWRMENRDSLNDDGKNGKRGAVRISEMHFPKRTKHYTSAKREL